MATIHQRVNGWLWNWQTGPGWVRDGAEMAKLRSDGMRVLKVQLQDNGPIPREQCDEWRAAGMKVWGAVGHVDGRDPRELAAWLRAERVRLALSGLDCNFEEDVRAMDGNSGGQWSSDFAFEARRLMPTLPLHIDTYYGSAAASPGINLGPYQKNGFRLTLQSYWGDGVYDDPPPRMVRVDSRCFASWPKALVKPLHRVVANSRACRLGGRLRDRHSGLRASALLHRRRPTSTTCVWLTPRVSQAGLQGPTWPSTYADRLALMLELRPAIVRSGRLSTLATTAVKRGCCLTR